jgi:hypothetical protein
MVQYLMYYSYLFETPSRSLLSMPGPYLVLQYLMGFSIVAWPIRFTFVLVSSSSTRKHTGTPNSTQAETGGGGGRIRFLAAGVK